MSKWIGFYCQHFSSPDEAEAFVASVEGLPPKHPKYPAMIMMHQSQRLISLADDVDAIRPNQYALKLMFLIICAENIAKLFHKYTGVGESKKHVRIFFDKFTSNEDKGILESGFKRHDHSNLTIDEVASDLYAIRCDVVHEGKYWGFQFKSHGMPMLNLGPDVNVHITYEEFKAVIARNCINAINSFVM
jgi:hypothetical protein